MPILLPGAKPLLLLGQADLALNWTVAVVAVTAFVVSNIATMLVFIRVFKEQMQGLTAAVKELSERVATHGTEIALHEQRLDSLEWRQRSGSPH